MTLINFSYFIGGVMLTLSLIGLVVSAILPVLDHWNKRYFIILFSTLLLTFAVCFIDLLIFMNPGMALAEKAVSFFEGLLLSVLAIMPTFYIMHYCGESRRNSPFFITQISIWCVVFALLLFAQFSPFIYQITPDNLFIIGPGFPLLMIPVAALTVVNLIAVIRRRKVLSKKIYIAFLIYLIPMMVCLFVHSFVFVFLYIDICLLIFAFVMFCIILSEQIDQFRLQQREIARQQANIMILQMRPHFIYNSLTSVYYLCDQNPKKAQQVLMDFTTYLRKNLTAISSEETIPFLEELSHTRAYLAVEHALHEDLLFIDYDTPHTRFRMPALTLQPIVENAIKHGLDPDAEPLHIFIRTSKTVSGTEITVADTGVGFDPNNETNPHTALSNIRQRLEMMCNGKMIIMPRGEGGTLVKIMIPSQED